MAKLTVPATELMDAGHLACQGCGAALAMRLFLKATGPNTTLVIPACCWAVITGPMPGTCLKVPTVFCAFETTAAVASGVKAGLRRRGLGDTIVAGFAGDGGTADIGLQALSGAAERNEDFIYVCYDNEAYMNTGIQRSGSTPPGAWTTTTPPGLSKVTGKKDLPAIMVAHGVPYVATLNPSFPEDFVNKVKRAVTMPGLRYLHILADCPTGWKHDPAKMVEVGRQATTSRVWPLYEVVNGRYRMTWQPSNATPLRDYLRLQARFAQLQEGEIENMQRWVDDRWNDLRRRCGEEGTAPLGGAKAAPLRVERTPVSPPKAPITPSGGPLVPSSPRAASGPAPVPSTYQALSPTTRAAISSVELPRCYKMDKPCDGSCGCLLPGGLCMELFRMSSRHL